MNSREARYSDWCFFLYRITNPLPRVLTSSLGYPQRNSIPSGVNSLYTLFQTSRPLPDLTPLQPLASADERPWLLQNEVRILELCGLIGVYGRIVKLIIKARLLVSCICFWIIAITALQKPSATRRSWQEAVRVHWHMNVHSRPVGTRARLHCRRQRAREGFDPIDRGTDFESSTPSDPV